MAQKWKCPDCGSLNEFREGNNICSKCDTEVLHDDTLEMVDDVIETSDLSDEGDEEFFEEVVEGYWICPKCESKNKGSKQGCSACGAIRGEDVEFFCDDDAPVITDEKELEAALSGPDWICEFCGNTSPASSKNCTGCGSPRSSGRKRKETEEKFDGTDTPIKEEPVKGTEKKPVKPVPAGPLPLFAKIGCGVFALIFLILMGFACSESKTKVKVTAASWALEVATERYQTCRDSGWRGEIPTGANQISSSKEIRRYNQVPDGTHMVNETYTQKVKTGTKKVKVGRVNKGNGRFVNKYKNKPVYKTVTKTRRVSKTKYRQVPVYEMKIVYTIDRWKSDKTLKASGENNLPVWPQLLSSQNTVAKIGDIRQKSKKEKYSITVQQLGKKDSHKIEKLRAKTLTAAQFIKLKIGTEWDAVINGLGQIVEIDLKETNSKVKK